MLRIALIGLTTIKELCRLINKVIRGSYNHQKLKALRSASERTNSTAKDYFAFFLNLKSTAYNMPVSFHRL
jgi:hypothetical protein